MVSSEQVCERHGHVNIQSAFGITITTRIYWSTLFVFFAFIFVVRTVIVSVARLECSAAMSVNDHHQNRHIPNKNSQYQKVPE